MSRAPLWRGLLALIILVTTGFFAFTQEPRLGLDLRGGATFTLETSDSPTTQANAESTDRTLEVLRRRIDALGVAEPTLARSGETRILVELPDVTDPAASRDAIGRTAQLTIHPVLGPGDPAKAVEDLINPSGTPVPPPLPAGARVGQRRLLPWPAWALAGTGRTGSCPVQWRAPPGCGPSTPRWRPCPGCGSSTGGLATAASSRSSSVTASS